MQSKTSFFNKAVFRKNFTRFAPVWGLYTLALLMGLFLMVDSDRVRQFAFNLTQLPTFMALVNCGYALLTAQLLFGDLYQSRSCYALHAMPLRRETWYATNILSGLVFSLIPTAVMTLAAEVMMAGSAVTGGWKIPMYLFVGVNLQYLLFFGMATLCSFCAGNRLGMIVAYGVLNFAAFGVALVIQQLYIPMLFGVAFDYDAYAPLFPLVNMAEGLDKGLMEIENFYDLMSQWRQDDMAYELILEFKLGGAWPYYWSCAAAGAAFLAAGLLLYRSRKLESAGDLLAIKALEPVFQIIVTLACAAAFQLIYICFSGGGSSDAQDDGLRGVLQSNAWYAFLAIGLAVGWFGGKMLLERSTSVFQKKNLPGLLAMAGVVALSLVLTALDPMGIATWVPKAEDVESVAFSESKTWGGIALDQPGDAERLIRLHELALADHVTYKEVEDKDYRGYDSFSVIYTLKNGRTARRYYNIWVNTETGTLLKAVKTRPEIVMSDYNGAPIETDKVNYFYVSGYRKDLSFADKEVIADFLAAVQADCREGTMAGGYEYHAGYFINENDPENLYASISVSLTSPRRGFNINIYPDSRNSLQWLKAHDPENRLGYVAQEGDYWQALEERQAGQEQMQ